MTMFLRAIGSSRARDLAAALLRAARVASLVCLGACGASAVDSNVPAERPTSGYTGPSWPCDGFAAMPDTIVDPPVVAGQPTVAAAEAKRLLVAERYPEAIEALRRVTQGQTSDDPGNVQLAEYSLAIALYRAKEWQASMQTFQAIARRPHHLKHGATLLWLANLSVDPSARPFMNLSDFATYTEFDVSQFRNSAQLQIFWRLSYLLGAQRHAARAYAESARFYSNVADQSPIHDDARRCLAISLAALASAGP
jgi:tetratricopeptide (TPR) repeat protein